MANRTTATEVRNIMDNLSDTTTDSIITAYINSAHITINEVFGTEDTDLLKNLEMWFSAHMIAVTRERQALKEEAGGAKIEYTGKYDQGLKMTSYGQMVLILDQSGVLASLGGKLATIYAVTSFND